MSSRKPAYCLHKPTGRAYVRLVRDGKRETIYLGLHGTRESRDRYDELISEWLVDRDVDSITITVGELSLRFDEWARTYYQHRDGTPTGTDRNIREAMRFVNRLFADIRARDFGERT
jgi:hypothetical protein